MTDDDVDSATLIVSRALAAEEGRDLPTEPHERGRANWRVRLSDPNEWSIVAVQDGKVLGVCNGRPEFDSTGNHLEGVGHFTNLFVEPETWGQGIGRALLRAGMARMRAQGYRKALLWSAADNDRANRLYESEGWSRTGAKQLGLDGRKEAQYSCDLD